MPGRSISEMEALRASTSALTTHRNASAAASSSDVSVAEEEPGTVPPPAAAHCGGAADGAHLASAGAWSVTAPASRANSTRSGGWWSRLARKAPGTLSSPVHGPGGCSAKAPHGPPRDPAPLHGQRRAKVTNLESAHSKRRSRSSAASPASAPAFESSHEDVPSTNSKYSAGAHRSGDGTGTGRPARETCCRTAASASRSTPRRSVVLTAPTAASDRASSERKMTSSGSSGSCSMSAWRREERQPGMAAVGLATVPAAIIRQSLYCRDRAGGACVFFILRRC